MASSAATRIWRVCKESGRPFPRLSEDDVIDYMIVEAVILKAGQEEQEMAKQQSISEWKSRAKDEILPQINM